MELYTGSVHRRRAVPCQLHYIPLLPAYCIYKVLFGRNATQLREQYGISGKENLRDYFSKEDLSAVQYMESLVSGLLGCGWGYDQVKAFINEGYLMNVAYNADCVEVMRQYPDGYFDLAVVDPPYGSGGGTFDGGDGTRFGGRFDRYKDDITDGRQVGGKVRKKIVSWDCAPGEDYFKELFRVSKEQIIWGGNYFGLPPNRCFLIWEKTNIPEKFTMAMAEYAWCSFNDNAKIIKLSSAGIAGRFHPTQKPEDLYRWIYQRYAKPGYKILDTHLGSGSNRRAAYDFGLDFVGCEIDKDYFEKQEKAFEEYTAQMRITV